MVTDIVQKLVDARPNSVMLVLDAYPILSDDDSWTNRTPPRGADVLAYQDHLRATLKSLHTAKLLWRTRFELFNEPNAPDFFEAKWYSKFTSAVDLAMEVLTNNVPGVDQGFAVPKDRIKCCAFTSDFMRADAPPTSNSDPRSNLIQGLFNLLMGYSHTSLADLESVALTWHWYPRKGIAPSQDNATPSDIYLGSKASGTDMPTGGMITEFNLDGWLSVNNRYGKYDEHGNWLKGYRQSSALDDDFRAILDYSTAHQFTDLYLYKLSNNNDEPNGVKIDMGFFDSTGCPKYEYVRMLELLRRSSTANSKLSPQNCPDALDWKADKPLP